MNHFKKLGKRGLALFAAFIMCFGMMPTNVSAATLKTNACSKVLCGLRGHSWGEYVTTVEPTCLVPGVAYRTCDKCGSYNLAAPKKVAATGHKFSSGRNIIQLGESDVFHWMQCENKHCRYSEMRRHKYSDATCTSPATCSICGHTRGKASGHTFGSYTQAGTFHVQICTGCGQASERTPHELAEISSVAATCTEDGSITYACKQDCGYTYTKTVPATGHHYADGSCTECGAEDPDSNTGCKTHLYSDKTAEVPATCEANGVKAHYSCLKCGKLFDGTNEVTAEELIIPRTTHKYGEKIAEVPATCTTEGTKAHYECIYCGKLFVGTNEVTAEELIIPCIAHVYGNPVNKKPATCTEDGMESYHSCVNCGQLFKGTLNTPVTKEELVIPATGHKLGSKINEVPATCTTNGVRAHYECTSCGKAFVATGEEVSEEWLTIPAAHKWTEWRIAQEPFMDDFGIAYEGIRQRNCTACGLFEKEDIPYSDHQ